ncbi:MAG: hypothetical protein ACXWG1_18310 [Usitatibacter sp.]
MEPEHKTAITMRRLTTALLAMLAVSIGVAETSTAGQAEEAETACGCPL